MSERQSADELLEEYYRPRLVEEMRMMAHSPFTAEADRLFYTRMAELFATKPWAEVVAVYTGAGEQSDGTGAAE